MSASLWGKLENVSIMGRRPLRWLEILAAATTIITAFAVVAFHDRDARVLFYFICALCVCLLLLMTIEEFRWHRKARFAEAQHWIHQAYHELRDAMWAVTHKQNDYVIQTTLQASLKSFAAAWSLVAGAACRVCVVELYCENAEADPKDDAFCVKALCRHENLMERSGLPDKLKDNSDFYLLWSDPTQRWFMCNDLTEELKRGYRNSHWPAGAVAQGALDYAAACVWPVRKWLVRVPSDPKSQKTQDLVGYLCVDSRTRGIFRERYDFDLGAAYADTLYSFLTIWRLRQRAEAKRNCM